MTPAINSFSGVFHFLSNFSDAEVWLDGMSYRNTEAAYQAAKTFDIRHRRKIQLAATPNDAKRLGRSVPLRKDWEDVKLDIMYSVVRQKFRQHHDLAMLLLDTGNAELIEGNWWGDTYWGVCKGVGHNHLGKTLMRVRHEIRDRIAACD